MSEFDFAAAQSDAEKISGGFADAWRMAGRKLEQAARQKVYFDNPAIWADEVLRKKGADQGIFLWSKQKEIAQSLVDNSYTAVKSCHGAGKSMSAAVFVCWFVTTRLAEFGNPNDVFVITTAPTYSQVHLVLWEEIRKFHALGKLPGYITSQDEWKINHDGRIIDLAVGRKPADTDANGFQGKHAFNLMIVLDEANGIPETLFTGAMSMLTGDMSRQKMLAIGNPDDPNSLFGQQDFKDRRAAADARVKANGEEGLTDHERNELIRKAQTWNWVQIKAWDTPNFTDERFTTPDVVLKSVLAKEWVDRARAQWAEDDPRWISKIEAEFPSESSDSFFNRNLIEQAKANAPDPMWEQEVNFLGVDLSRYGKDRSVMAHNLNGVVTIADEWSKSDAVASARRIHEKALELHVTQVRVDEGNIGGAVIDFLRTMMGYNYRVVVMNSSHSSPDLMRWRNARAFWYDNLKESMMLNRIQIPTKKELEDELSAIRYKIHKSGSLLMEDKDEIAKRLNGKSTDFADAVVYASVDLSIYIENPFDDEQPPRAGETRVLEFGEEMMLQHLVHGFSVSPV